jgi:hypothetical protein
VRPESIRASCGVGVANYARSFVRCLDSSVGLRPGPGIDLRDFLNGLPGPALTMTDVTQRMRAFEDEDYFSCPKEELQPGCLAIYEREKPTEVSCRQL